MYYKRNNNIKKQSDDAQKIRETTNDRPRTVACCDKGSIMRSVLRGAMRLPCWCGYCLFGKNMMFFVWTSLYEKVRFSPPSSSMVKIEGNIAVTLP